MQELDSLLVWTSGSQLATAFRSGWPGGVAPPAKVNDKLSSSAMQMEG